MFLALISVLLACRHLRWFSAAALAHALASGAKAPQGYGEPLAPQRGQGGSMGGAPIPLETPPSRPYSTAMLTAIPLTEAQSEEVARLLASGACADASEVVAAGLEALAAQEAAIDAWLRREVAPAAEALAADPSRAIPAEQVFAELRAHHARRLAEG